MVQYTTRWKANVDRENGESDNDRKNVNEKHRNVVPITVRCQGHGGQQHRTVRADGEVIQYANLLRTTLQMLFVMLPQGLNEKRINSTVQYLDDPLCLRGILQQLTVPQEVYESQFCDLFGRSSSPRTDCEKERNTVQYTPTSRTLRMAPKRRFLRKSKGSRKIGEKTIPKDREREPEVRHALDVATTGRLRPCLSPTVQYVAAWAHGTARDLPPDHEGRKEIGRQTTRPTDPKVRLSNRPERRKRNRSSSSMRTHRQTEASQHGNLMPYRLGLPRPPLLQCSPCACARASALALSTSPPASSTEKRLPFQLPSAALHLATICFDFLS